MATIFASSGALKKRGELDANQALMDFSAALEAATLANIDPGIMSEELALLAETKPKPLSNLDFIRAIRKRIQSLER